MWGIIRFGCCTLYLEKCEVVSDLHETSTNCKVRHSLGTHNIQGELYYFLNDTGFLQFTI